MKFQCEWVSFVQSKENHPPPAWYKMRWRETSEKFDLVSRITSTWSFPTIVEAHRHTEIETTPKNDLFKARCFTVFTEIEHWLFAFICQEKYEFFTKILFHPSKIKQIIPQEMCSDDMEEHTFQIDSDNLLISFEVFGHSLHAFITNAVSWRKWNHLFQT